MTARGYSSCRFLANLLHEEFGDLVCVDELSPEQDAFGWRLAAQPRYLFSVSTYAGELPFDKYDLQVSIVDETLENGDIVFGPESSLLASQQICEIVAKFKSESIG